MTRRVMDVTCGRSPRWLMDLRLTLLALRSAVGVATWVSPASTRLFGLQDMADDPHAALVTRLFGVRDLALAQALRSSDAAVVDAALRAGVAVDAVDTVASLLALRRGASPASSVGVGVGALTFVGLGIGALRQRR